MTQAEAGTVLQLWRLPVQSMRGERLAPCAGIYASVATLGVVAIGDRVTID